jgi:hypothetical protein
VRFLSGTQLPLFTTTAETSANAGETPNQTPRTGVSALLSKNCDRLVPNLAHHSIHVAVNLHEFFSVFNRHLRRHRWHAANARIERTSSRVHDEYYQSLRLRR